MACAGSRTRQKWLSVLLISAGAFLAWYALHGDDRWVAAGWPWLLLAMAVVNLARSALTFGSLIAPSVLTAAACGGLMIKADAASVPAMLIIACLIVLGGLGLLRPGAWTRIMVTGRVRVSAPPVRLVVLRAVAGELRADFTHAALGNTLTVRVTALAGHVHITVPRSWPVMVLSAGTALTRFTDTGGTEEVSSGSTGYLALHLLGLGGAISLVRV